MSNEQEQWTEKITAWRRSGQSVAAWCRQNDVTYHRFLYWRKRLQQTMVPVPTPFVELTFEHTYLAVECNGVTLHIERGFDRDLLRQGGNEGHFPISGKSRFPRR